jgi:hypothetical protein
MTIKQENMIQKVIMIVWNVGMFITFTWLGYWYIGLAFILCFCLLYWLFSWVLKGKTISREVYDERQNQQKNNGYKYGLILGALLLFFLPGIFSSTESFAFFVIGMVASFIGSYRMLTGSFFGYNLQKKEVLSASLIYLFLGFAGVFLYGHNIISGTEKIVEAGRISIQPTFWLFWYFLVTGIAGGIYLVKESWSKQA